jgi:hypothetical protein
MVNQLQDGAAIGINVNELCKWRIELLGTILIFVPQSYYISSSLEEKKNRADGGMHRGLGPKAVTNPEGVRKFQSAQFKANQSVSLIVLALSQK